MAKKIKYIKQFKVFEEELTWDLFIKYLNEHMEFFFYFNDQAIDIAFHYEDGTKIYELNISQDEHISNVVFDTIDKLISYKAFEGKSLYDIWEYLET